MEDNYFDKKLKHILESPPELQPDVSAMLDMQKRLRGNAPNKKRPGLLWLIPLIFLPIFLGAGVFYKKYQALSNQVSQLNQQVTQIKEIHFRDTILEKQIIHHYDTIINVIYREKYIKDTNKNNTSINYLSSYSRPTLFQSVYTDLLSSINSNYSNWSPKDDKNYLLTYHPGSSVLDPVLQQKNLDINSNNFKKINFLESLGPFFLDVSHQQNSDEIKQLIDQIPEYKLGETKPEYYFVPIGFTVGAKTSPAVFLLDAFDSQGKTYGISGAIEFPGNRSLQIGFEWLTSNFEIKDDPVSFNLFPITNPTDPTDILHELKGNFNSLQIPITIRQKFLNDKKLNPFINIGLTAYKPLNQQFTYEYIDGTGEYKLNETFRDGEFSIDNLRLGLGAEYTLKGPLSAISEVQYQHAFSQGIGEYYKLRHWSFNLGLRYQLIKK